MRVCEQCDSHIKKRLSIPPKDAIGNGFYVGTLPQDSKHTAWPEHLMTQLVTVVAQTRIMRGYQHRAIRSQENNGCAAHDNLLEIKPLRWPRLVGFRCKNMYFKTAVTCKRYPQFYDGYDTLTCTQLADILHSEWRQRGKEPISCDISKSTSNAVKIIRSVEISSVSVWGSNAKRKKCRREPFA